MQGNKCYSICPVTVVLGYIAFVGVGYLLHNYMMMDLYNKTAELWATQAHMQENLMFYYIGSLIFTLLAAIIFKRGYEGGGIEEGTRFGLIIGIALAALRISVYPFHKAPLDIVYAWALADVLQSLAMGIAFAMVYSHKYGAMACGMGDCEIHTETVAPAKKPVAKKSAAKKKK